jgi:2-keto-4-pentenoate hydratase
MDAATADAAASMLAAAWRGRDQIDDLADEIRPSNLDEAYDVQRRMIDALSHLPVGWKVGASNENAMKRFGFSEPFYGRLLDGAMHQSPATLAADLFSRRGLETEFAFRLTSDLPAHGAPFDRAAVIAAAAELVPAIEIIDSRFTTWPKVSPFSFIADNGTHGRFVMGQLHSDWSGHDLAAQAARISVNNERGSRLGCVGRPGQRIGLARKSIAGGRTQPQSWRRDHDGYCGGGGVVRGRRYGGCGLWTVRSGIGLVYLNGATDSNLAKG